MTPGLEAVSVQDRLFPTLRCFGCGPANDLGLRLQSFETSGRVVARFRPWAEHDNGAGYLNGGIIGTVLDCHGAAVVHLEAERRGWPPAPGEGLAFVTAGLDVRFLRPTPLEEELEIGAELLEVSEGQMVVLSYIDHDGKRRAEAQALWKRWRPRR